MNDEVLVVGATGQVGSQVVKILAGQGRPVRAMVRSAGSVIHGAPPSVRYVLGDLNHPESLDKAIAGVDVVVSTANAVIPRSRKDNIREMSGAGYEALIRAAERHEIRRFVQSSVPTHKMEDRVPELRGKRAIETRLEASPISHAIIRNPAFTDIWIVMSGARQAIGEDPHATLRRPFGFSKTWLKVTGNLVVGRNRMFAFGDPDHGSPFITTHDVAQLLAASVAHPAADNVIWEAGGPEWVTWRRVGELFEARIGSPVKTTPLPAWFIGAGRAMMQPFSSSATGVLALAEFVATYQPRWDSKPLVDMLGLPPQTTVEEYLERNFWPVGRATPKLAAKLKA